MRTFSGTGFSRPTLMRLMVVATGILVLPVVMFTLRKQVADSSMAPSPPPGNSPSREEMSRTRSSMEKICFVRGAWIYVANLVTKQETKLVEGENPHLAPTGESIVFISVKENEGIDNRIFPPPGRLRLLNLRTKEIRDFSELRDIHTGDTIWSNDGSRIAFTLSISHNEQPYIAVLNPDTGKLEKKITEGWDPIPGNNGIYLDSWAPDDQSVLFHTTGALYKARLDDGLVQKIPIKELFETGEDFSGTRLSFSSDRRYLLFHKIIDTPDEPVTEVIYVFDLTTKTLRRVSPKNVQGRDPVWLPSNREILFTRVEWVNDKWRPSICKIGLDGVGLT